MKKIVILVTVLSLAACVSAWAAQAKANPKPVPAKEAKAPAATMPMEAKGKVVSFTATSLVVSSEVKGKKTDTTFVLNPETQVKGTLANGAEVEVAYRTENSQNVATQVTVHEAAKHARRAKH